MNLLVLLCYLSVFLALFLIDSTEASSKQKCDPFWKAHFPVVHIRSSYCKEIQSIHSEGDKPWDFFGRNDAEAETPVLWPPHAKS